MNQYTAVSAPTSPPGGVWSHDKRGNLVDDGSRRFTWTGQDNLASATVAGETAEYGYDSRSRRVVREENGVTTLFVYDDWNVIAEYQLNRRRASLSKRYVWGEDLSGTLQGAGGVGGLLMAETVNRDATTEPVFFHYDGNGNVTELTDKDAKRVATYRYEAFGKVRHQAGPAAEQNTYRFSTKPEERTTGFSYYGYRFYDPEVGRWIKRDPMNERGGVNLSRMLSNNLIDQWDRLGLHMQNSSCRSAEDVGNVITRCSHFQNGPSNSTNNPSSANYSESRGGEISFGVGGVSVGANGEVTSSQGYVLQPGERLVLYRCQEKVCRSCKRGRGRRATTVCKFEDKGNSYIDARVEHAAGHGKN